MIPNNRIEFAPLRVAGPRLRSAAHAERYTHMRLLTYLGLLFTSGALAAGDHLSQFIGKYPENIEGARIERGWMLYPQHPAKSKYAATILITNDQRIVVTVDERERNTDQKSRWVIRNAQVLGMKTDGEFISGCITAQGFDYRYVALVDHSEEFDRERNYHKFRRVWKFDSNLMQFTPVAEQGLKCPAPGSGD